MSLSDKMKEQEFRGHSDLEYFEIDDVKEAVKELLEILERDNAVLNDEMRDYIIQIFGEKLI